MAADLPRRAAPPEYFAPVPVFTWTGFYVGVNAGYAWTNDNNADSTVFVPAGSLSTVLTPLTPPAGTFVNTFGFNNSRSGDGFTFGGTLGYNWQTAGGFVWGVEGDINWVDIGGSGNDAFFGGGFNTTTFAGGGAAINRTYDIVSATRSSGFDWFGTARVRLGWAIDRTLIYATGGFAFASGGDRNNNFGFDNCVGCGGLFNNNNNDWRTGWTIGGGVEYAFNNNLTVKLEGLWVNLDSGDRGGAVAVPVRGNLNPATFLPGSSKNDNEFFIARLGVNWKFGL